MMIMSEAPIPVEAQAPVYDIAIVGGGIHGLTLACEAAALGLKTIVFEAGDIASGASSATSGLFSGDIRQLENLALETVRNNLQEQALACKRAPHLVRPRLFALLDNLDVRSHRRVRTGCFLYRRMQPLKISRDDYHCPRAFLTKPFLSDTGNSIHVYTDCLLNGSRYTVSQALAAKAHGAVILPRHRLTQAARLSEKKHWLLQVENPDKHPLSFHANILVNAAGEAASHLLQEAIQRPSRCQVKRFGGSTLVVRKPEWPRQCFTLQSLDGRLVTVTPYHHQCFLIGSSQSPALEPCPQQEQQLIDLVNHHFQNKLSADDIVHRHWGIRAIYDDPTCCDTQKSRQYFLDLDCPDGHTPLLNIFGGSLAGHRRLAIQALRILQPYSDKTPNQQQAELPLPGGDIIDGDIEAFIDELHHSYPLLPIDLIQRLANNYGSLSYRVLQDAKRLGDLGHHFGHRLYEQEVRYLCEEEWANSSDDILYRRTHLGLVFSEEEKAALQEWLASNI
jgi:glycerol-3-phosphate dehydrogenase